MIRATSRRSLAMIAFMVPIVFGCEKDSGQTPHRDAPAPIDALATVDDVSIPASVVDFPLRLDLYDLEYAQYQMRRDRLEMLIRERLGSNADPGSRDPDSNRWKQRVEILLTAPTPPRLEIPYTDGPTRGLETAPITIVAFVDFESTHNRRLQPILVALLDRYPDRVRLQVRDLPLPYHRNASQAAHAVHCAADQERYWAYHDLLLIEQSTFSASDLIRYAKGLSLDTNQFGDCLSSRRHAERIQKDIDLAATFGIRRAGTVFVNGLYLAGRPGLAEFEDAIQAELRRLGLDPKPSRTSRDRRGPMSVADTAASALPAIPTELLNDPEVVLTISRSEVAQALRNRRQLERKLEADSREYSGQRLLKIRTVEDDDFYSRLGLKDSDVLMVVNGQFLTADHNTLWDAFESGDTVTILVMRRGFPHTYEYRIR